MRRICVGEMILALATVAGCAGPAVREDVTLGSYFGRYDAAFVMRDLRTSREVHYGGPRCNRRVSPCSTFKVPHTVAAIDAGLIDENTVFKWDGVHRTFEPWNQDQTLQTAMQRSAVWCYQEIARRMGLPRERHYLDLFQYGNRDCSGGLEQFWLMSSLKISPVEQVRFLDRLYTNRLPVPAHAVELTRRLLVLEQTGSCVLSGKTGTGVADGGKVINNWFAGHVKTSRGEWVFATNLQGPVKDRFEAPRITRKLLQDTLGVPIKQL